MIPKFLNVWPVAPVEERPSVTLRRWQVVQVPLPELEGATMHFIGDSMEDSQGQVSSPILTFDPASGKGVSRSGRIYKLEGPPSYSGDAEYVWRVWCRVNAAGEAVDLTEKVYGEICARSATEGK
jgi:hypothetical protein